MRIVYIFRKNKPGRYSIEKVFNVVSTILKNKNEVIDYFIKENIIYDILSLRKLNADIYHITGDVNYLSFFLPRKKTVLTIHDIGHYIYTLKGIKRHIYKYFWLTFPIKLVAKTTAVSDSTQTDIIDKLKIDRERIIIINNCYCINYNYIKKEFNHIQPTILQVGTASYKNVERLISAIHGLKCKLIIVGKLNTIMLSELEKNAILYDNYIGISDEELLNLYNISDIVSFISINEGFGMPIIEAQALGIALVTSNRPPMSLIAGLNSCLADPFSVVSIRECFDRIIFDSEYRNKIIYSGLLNSKKYSPEFISDKYFKLYKSI